MPTALDCPLDPHSLQCVGGKHPPELNFEDEIQVLARARDLQVSIAQNLCILREHTRDGGFPRETVLSSLQICVALMGGGMISGGSRVRCR